MLCSIIHDISDIRRTETNLRGGHSLAQLFSHAPSLSTTAASTADYLGKTGPKDTGYSRRDEGRFIDDLIALPETFEDALSNTNRVVAGETIFFEGARRRKNGDYIHEGTPLSFLVGKGGCYSIYMDQTQMKQAENRLRVMRNGTAAVEDLAMVCSFDEEGRLSRQPGILRLRLPLRRGAERPLL
ncbi:hypothetical protein MASR2M17_20840 [Aminivibrio sp.]